MTKKAKQFKTLDEMANAMDHGHQLTVDEFIDTFPEAKLPNKPPDTKTEK